jgi:hypothetical protein
MLAPIYPTVQELLPVNATHRALKYWLDTIHLTYTDRRKTEKIDLRKRR